MKYGKHLVSTIGNDQLNAYFRHFAGYLTCSSNFRGYKRPRKLKTANIYPHVLEAKTRKFGDAKNIPFYGSLHTGYLNYILQPFEQNCGFLRCHMRYINQITH